jgi:hypothetical protein
MKTEPGLAHGHGHSSGKPAKHQPEPGQLTTALEAARNQLTAARGGAFVALVPANDQRSSGASRVRPVVLGQQRWAAWLTKQQLGDRLPEHFPRLGGFSRGFR